jgi:hypothetical protein
MTTMLTVSFLIRKKLARARSKIINTSVILSFSLALVVQRIGCLPPKEAMPVRFWPRAPEVGRVVVDTK